MRLMGLAAATLAVTMTTACASTQTASPDAEVEPASASSDFRPCDDATPDRLAGSLCATMKAPLRHDDPASGEVELFVRKFPAQGVSRGDVWLVAGGPGEAGASFYGMIDRFRAAFPGYDILVPDHRGTGRSSRVCVAEEAQGSPGGRGLEGAEWGSCLGQLGARSPWTQSFTVTNAAHDLHDLIGRYSRGRTVHVYGVSYGTQLVLRMMTVAPPPAVEGIVLDSLVPPDGTEVWDLSHRSQVVDAVGRAVLADCDRDPACRAKVGGSAVEALQRVVDDPERAKLFPGGQPKAFLGALLDAPDARALIPDVIADALAGRKDAIERAQARLEAFYAPFASPDAASSIPLVALISASENNARLNLTREDIAAESGALLFTSSLPSQLLGGADMTYPRDAAFGHPPARLPPLLVLQGDMDPKTPLAGAEAHAATLPQDGDIRFVTVAGAPHFVLLTDPAQAEVAIAAFVSDHRRARQGHRPR
jgi:pimeloyl-ACP methyl ester carboxylesterase